MNKNLFQKLLLFSLCLFSLNSFAKTIEIKISEGSPIAKARYSEGNENQPALLFLHGYLATHQFPLIQNLQDYFNFEGYTTLAPTLSLQVPARDNSLNCNSLHLHTLAQDLAEIEGWVNWLKEKGHQEIVLIGHSAGSIQLLELAATRSGSEIKKIILTSLLFLDPDEFNINKLDIEKAGQKIIQNDFSPDTYSFIFCIDNYLATPESFLSYLPLTQQRVLDNLANIKIPTFVIMGSKDDRLGQPVEDWIKQLNQTSGKIFVIENANHFFSGEHEYILQHRLQKIIETKD